MIRSSNKLHYNIKFLTPKSSQEKIEAAFNEIIDTIKHTIYLPSTAVKKAALQALVQLNLTPDEAKSINSLMRHALFTNPTKMKDAFSKQTFDPSRDESAKKLLRKALRAANLLYSQTDGSFCKSGASTAVASLLTHIAENGAEAEEKTISHSGTSLFSATYKLVIPGKGLIVDPNTQEEYSGQIKNQLPEGQGIKFFNNGATFSGTWQAGQPHGDGVNKLQRWQ